MPRFDWQRFLDSRHVDYVRAGPRQVVVHCPFCGADDPSHHMSINLDGRGWRCWRAPRAHYGRAPNYLVQKLLGCSAEEAQRITGEDVPPPPPAEDTLADQMARLRGGPPVPSRPRTLEMPTNFHPLLTDDPRAGPFWDYLVEDRGYREAEVRWLADTYDLRWTTTGPFAWRVIFPVRGRRGELLTWTGRAISPRTEPRYRQPRAADVVLEAPRTLWGLNRLWEVADPRVLVLTEGPLDAARISVSGAPMGVWGTCLFGLAFGDDQRDLVVEMAERFPRVALLLDPEARHERARMVRRLFPLPVALPELPSGVGDPGELTPAQASQLCMDLLV